MDSLTAHIEDLVRSRTNNAVDGLVVNMEAEGTVCISGETATFYNKQMAQESVFRSHPGLRVKNFIRVRGI